MSDQEKPKKNYIRYTAEELARIPSPWQMEKELGKVWEQYGLGSILMVNVEQEYRLMQELGLLQYVQLKRVEAAARRVQDHRHY